MRFHTPGWYDRCGSRLVISGATTRRVPPVRSDRDRTSVMPESAPSASTGTSARPPDPPVQLTATTTTSTTTTAAAASRRLDQSRTQPGRRCEDRSRVFSTAVLLSSPTPAAAGSRCSAAACGVPTDLRELVRVEAGTADERTVDVRPGQDP